MPAPPPPAVTLFVQPAGERSVTVSGLPPDELIARLTEGLGDRFAIVAAPRSSDRDQRRNLSERELSILRFIARGLSNQEIAEELFLSNNTIKSYIRSAYRKIQVNTRPQAVLWGVRRGLDAPDQPPPTVDEVSPPEGRSEV